MMIRQVCCLKIFSRSKSLAQAARALSWEPQENLYSLVAEALDGIVILQGLAPSMVIIGSICKDFQDIQLTQILGWLVNAKARSTK